MGFYFHIPLPGPFSYAKRIGGHKRRKTRSGQSRSDRFAARANTWADQLDATADRMNARIERGDTWVDRATAKMQAQIDRIEAETADRKATKRGAAASGGAPVSAGPPAGWYPDQHGRQRWWDGLRWTEHTR